MSVAKDGAMASNHVQKSSMVFSLVILSVLWGNLISLIIELIDSTALIDFLLFGNTPRLGIVSRVRFMAEPPQLGPP